MGILVKLQIKLAVRFCHDPVYFPIGYLFIEDLGASGVSKEDTESIVVSAWL